MGNALVATASRSWTLIQLLATQLATITVANGYLTDLGLNIWTTDSQRPDSDALGAMIYSETIAGPGVDQARAGKPVRELSLLIECAIGTDQDDAQQQIHSVIEDVENCMSHYAQAFGVPIAGVKQASAMYVTDVAILDRPEGAPVIACQVRVVARYFR